MLDIELTYDPAIFYVYTQKKWKYMTTQNLYTNVHDIIIHNSQKEGITQMSLSWWTDKQNVVNLYDDILLAMKINEILAYTTT